MKKTLVLAAVFSFLCISYSAAEKLKDRKAGAGGCYFGDPYGQYGVCDYKCPGGSPTGYHVDATCDCPGKDGIGRNCFTPGIVKPGGGNGTIKNPAASSRGVFARVFSTVSSFFGFR